jgi:hypothetical protein
MRALLLTVLCLLAPIEAFRMEVEVRRFALFVFSGF